MQSELNTLLVEDDNSTRCLIEGILTARGYRVTACASGESAWDAFRRSWFPLVLLDWGLPGMDGLELCRRLRELPEGERSVILIFTSRDQTADLEAVLDAGADDYMTKPVDARLLRVRLAIAERRVRDRARQREAEETVGTLRRLLDQKSRFHGLIGKSAVMQTIYEQIRDVAAVDATVLIEGETGTGKELVARAIHAASPRREGPFVAVNSAGLTESLLASQLFGHRRGSFTGAVEDHRGFFESANGGTVFLDEIGDIPVTVQISLLRVLQEREVLRLGDSKPRKVDVRVVAATHRTLTEEVSRGSFRADLLYRIRVARIHLPPLRERREDIPMLADTFLSEIRATTGKAIDSIGTDALRALVAYPWPGNVRELRSAVEFGVIRSRGSVIELGDLPPELSAIDDSLQADLPIPDEKQRIIEALNQTGGRRTAAAQLLGMSRATFYRRLTELGIDPTATRDKID